MTREVQFDEKWAFVGRKQKNCNVNDPDDDHCGDYWDFVAYDPEHRLVLIVVPGTRSLANAEITVEETKARLGDEPPLITSDELAAYATAIEATFGEPAPAPERRGPGRPRVAPDLRLPAGVCYATVHKHRENGRVVAVEQKQVFGTSEDTGGGARRVDGQQEGEHLVPGASARTDRGRNCEEGAEDVPLQQGLADPRGGHIPDDVQLQLLLVRADAPVKTRRALAGADAGHGGGVDRSRMGLAGTVERPAVQSP